MLIEALRLIVVLVSVVVSNRVATARPEWFGDANHETAVFVVTALGAFTGYLLGGMLARLVDRLLRGAEEHLARRHVTEILAATLGVLIGLVSAAVVSWPLLLVLEASISAPIVAFVSVVIVAFAVRLTVRKRLELFGVMGVVPGPDVAASGCLLDASAAIDGRVLALFKAGMLPQPICVPSFILWELQGIADSGDPMRRRRGQRGLDVLQSLREARAEVRVLDEDPAATTDPDAKLVIVAKRRGLPVVTSDGNLAKAAELQGIEVLNLHALAELLRPPVLPGEVAEVKIVKPGREAKQGIGYLEDGTMVVVEDAQHLVGEEVSVEVTSLLQTDTGRMLFGKPAEGSAELREVT